MVWIVEFIEFVEFNDLSGRGVFLVMPAEAGIQPLGSAFSGFLPSQE
jgi:hypothetical protein